MKNNNFEIKFEIKLESDLGPKLELELELFMRKKCVLSRRTKQNNNKK
jgi:hypothetical protein